MELKKLASNLGADLFGVADLKHLKNYPSIPSNLLEKYSAGIVIAIKIPDDVIDGLPVTRPLYATQYRIINEKLDMICSEIARYIEGEGYRALPIPASKILKGTNWRSFISHKAIARAAGVGWIGKSLLLITEEYGPRVRFASILTDMPLEPGDPYENKCGECRECIEACTAKALVDSYFRDYPRIREEFFRIDRCVELLKSYEADPDIGYMVCGICVKVCPWGKKKEF